MTTRQGVNRALKIAVSHALSYTGLLRLRQSIVMRGRAVILMYHRVLTGEERRGTASHPALVVDRVTFTRQMTLLKRHFRVLSLSEFAEKMERGIPFQDSSCLITFDDGWRDTFTNAFPVLQALQLPALVFLPVNYVGGNRLFWQEALTHLVLRAQRVGGAGVERQTRLRELLKPIELECILESRASDPRPAIIEAVSSLKGSPIGVIGQLIDRLGHELGVTVDDLMATDGFVDWDQVRTMARHGIAFGAHGFEHLLLTHASPAEARREIRGSKEVIDGTPGMDIPTFSYPNGYWTPAIADEVEAAGYRLAFTTRRGLVDCRDNRFTLSRFNLHQGVTDTMPMFLARLVGLF